MWEGAQRLILSGGEPTIPPDFVKFVKLGNLAGYRKVQTVTNGRMFAYPDFLKRSLDAGLSEITFSIHGPNARVHDALVGTKGAFEQEVTGLKNAMADGRPVWLVAATVAEAEETMQGPTAAALELELEDLSGVEATLGGVPVTRVLVKTAEHAQALLAMDATFEVAVALSKTTAPWLL